MPHRSVVVGYSLGARFAAHAVASGICRAKALVLVGLHVGLSGHEKESRARADSELASRIESSSLEAAIELWEHQDIFRSQWDLPSAVRTARRNVRRANTTVGLAWSLRNQGLAAWPSMFEALSRVEIPCHVVVGEHDVRYAEFARTFASLSNVFVHVVRNAGHDVALERPAALAEIIALAERGAMPKATSETEDRSHVVSHPPRGCHASAE